MDDFFHEIENKYNIKINEEPLQLSGGFLHKMFALSTDRGRFAVKLLNPSIMRRDTAMANYAEAERLEAVLEERGINIQPALMINGRKMQNINGQFFYIFAYFDGKPLTADEIKEYHCSKMGKALASIHNIDRKASPVKVEEMHIDWEYYLRTLEKQNEDIYLLLRDNLELIEDIQEKGNSARYEFPQTSAICHNDMDPKNVLWNGDSWRIIDLECLSYGNPMTELFETALCWAGYQKCNFKFSLFNEFISGYHDAGGEIPRDWSVLYDCSDSRLEWLEYNLKRTLGIEGSGDEIKLGIEQTKATINSIIYYKKIRNDILECCSKLHI